MHNLIKSRALFEILKTPLPELHFAVQDSDESLEGDGLQQPPQPVYRGTALNVNAREFVPSSKRSMEGQKNCQLDEPKLPRPLPQQLLLPKMLHKTPQLILPWKGFPKRERPPRSPRHSTKHAQVLHTDCHLGAKLKHTRNNKLPATIKTIINRNIRESKHAESLPGEKAEANAPPVGGTDSELEERRREQERKVAVEALKLVEQRRKREPLVTLNVDAQAQPQSDAKTVHLTRSPVRFSPKERERVDHLRKLKRERIERVLRDMQEEQQLKMLGIAVVEQPPVAAVEPSKLTNPAPRRYIPCIKPPATELALPEPVKLPESVPPKRYIALQRETEAKPKPKRYIPTTKQWDMQRREKLEQQARENKENMIITTEMLEQLSNNPKQKPIITTLQPCKQPQKEKPELTAPGRKPTGERLAAPIAKLPLARAETRRGNQTHAYCIMPRVFNKYEGMALADSMEIELKQLQLLQLNKPNVAVEGAAAVKKPLKRYDMAKLLSLEPMPAQLVSPQLDAVLLSFGLLYNYG